MKKLLLLPALCFCSTAFAQKPVDCNAVKTENAALKEKIVAYEARLGIGVGGVTVTDGDDKIKVKFLSCLASKSTHKAIFAFQVMNSDEPAGLDLYSDPTNNRCHFLDEQGQDYASYFGYVGKDNFLINYSVVIPTNAPVKCRVELKEVPLSIMRLNTVVLAFSKRVPGMSKATDFKTTIKNMPVTWVP